MRMAYKNNKEKKMSNRKDGFVSPIECITPPQHQVQFFGTYAVTRMSVPGGWNVTTVIAGAEGVGVSSQFISDPEHTWEVDAFPIDWLGND
jgi:hypothetical protein